MGVYTEDDLDDKKDDDAGKVNYDVKPFASGGNIKVSNEMYEINDSRYQ